MEKGYEDLKKQKELLRKLNEERAQQNSKKQLMSNVQKKMKTTMIGALATFEEGFGHLWGHGKHIDDLTPSEEEYRQIWDAVRSTVLDKGNNQSRAAMDEIAQYTMNWNRFNMNLVVKPKGN